MIKVAITGNIGSGKSTITKVIRELGFKVFDSDKEVKKALMKKDLINQISKEFKSKIPGLIKRNAIDKAKLGEFVFSNPDELKKLENIVHPRVWESKEKFFEKNCNESVVFLDIPLLFEKKLQSKFDFIIRTRVSEEVQKKRVLKRRNMTTTKFNHIRRTQTDYSDIEEKHISLDINTQEDIKIIKKRVKNFLEKILNLKKELNLT
tara:strand:- start:1219 stop:1836 length:618 start_codon:yes stop_codon:yes gene_type:complete